MLLLLFRGSHATATPDTHDGGAYSSRERDELRRRFRKYEQARDRSEKERKQAGKRLQEALERAYEQVVETTPVPAIIAAAEAPTVFVDGAFAPVAPDWAAMLGDIAALQRMIVVLDERMREDEDLEIILMAAI